MKHLIIDTDIGGDPDDAIALLLALNSPEVTLDLIVTSDEHGGHRAAFARALLQTTGLRIPVVGGSDLGNDKYCLVHDLVKAEGKQTDDYLSAIRNVMECNEHTDYVCIGPQTNIAAFIGYAPELQTKMSLTMMGGGIDYRKRDVAEHNIRYDILAARAVFDAAVSKRYVISDTTFNELLAVDRTHPIYDAIDNSPCRDLLLPSFERFFNNYHPASLMHDPLTLCAVLNDEYVSFTTRNLLLDEQGIMRLSEDGRPTCVSSGAKHAEFMRFLTDRLA